MGLETATYISGLNASNPVNATDVVGEGDDHLRLIKSTLLNTFPNITGAMTLTHTQLNAAAIKSEANIFTANQRLQSTQPTLFFEETDASVDEGHWKFAVAGGDMYLQLLNDSDATPQTALLITRTGVSVDAVRINVASGESAIWANANSSVDLYYDGAQKFRTQANGIDLCGTSANDPFIGFYTTAMGTRQGYIQFSDTGGLVIAQEVHGATVNIQAEDAGGTSRTLLLGDPDASTSLFYAGTQRFATSSSGYVTLKSDASTDTENRAILFAHQDGAIRGRVGYIGSNALFIRNEVHGADVTIAGEDAGGTQRTILNGDPDGICDLYYSGTKHLRVNSGIIQVLSAGNTDAESRAIYFEHQDGTDRGYVGYVGDSVLTVRNVIHGGLVLLSAEDSGGTLRNMVRCDPGAGVWLYENETTNETALITQGRTGDNTTTATVRHRIGTFYDIGMNLVPELDSLDSGNVTLAANSVGLMLTYNSATARSLFLNNDSNIPAGAMWSVIVGPSAGVLTGDGGTGVVLRYWSGAAWTDTAAAGNITIGEGQHTIWKETDTLYWISGPNLS